MRKILPILLFSIFVVQIHAQVPAFFLYNLGLKSFSNPFSLNNVATQMSNLSNITVYGYPLTDQPSNILIEAFDGSKAKNVFEYSDGEVVQIVAQQWAIDDWENSERQSVLYNTSGYPSETKISLWNGFNWIDDTKTEFSYDNTGKVIDGVDYVANTSGWSEDAYYQYLYEQDADTIVMTTQFRSTSDDVWENVQKLRYAYNTSVKPIMQETYLWSGEDWVVMQRLTVSYDTYGRELQWNVKSLHPSLYDTKYIFSYTNDRKIENIDIAFFYSGRWIDYLSLTYSYEISSVENNTYNEVSIAFSESELMITSSCSEQISVYSASGVLITQIDKKEGRIVKKISNANEFLIVKGSSGWVKKIVG